ncbi:inactive peptidyl-prolyl cis-trans isomerase shutdown-like [Epargyreus clarus]|uniref:inactive peptidyl-prolyl cis-trans isomerase shutdown-like n=1 Tax=Epargyreus clarus TaxID=520877 RepID=UPI003C2AFA2D
MDEMYTDPVPLSKGINMRELLNSATEFHIDTDFKKKKQDSMFNCDEDLFPDLGDVDSDSEDVLKSLEESTKTKMLDCPEYHSFDELSKQMIDCVPSGDVKMLILEEGTGPIVPVDAEVTIHYAAYWEKANIPFDTTLTMNAGEPIRIRLGKGKFLPGIEIGLTSVRGPTARLLLLLRPAAAWGPRGVPPRVRPEPALFSVALYAVRDVQAAARFNDLPQEEQCKYEVTMRTVNSLHTEAKNLFSMKKYLKCIKNYQQSMSVLRVSLPKNSTEEEKVKRLRINAYVNLAVCYYKINKPKYVLRMCENLDNITDIEKHCKALFYYGRGYELLGKNDQAAIYYKKALKLEPKNKEIGNALANLDNYNRNAVLNEKKMWQTVFKTVEEKKIVYDVDEDFQNGVRDMCQSMAGNDEYAKFDLPNGLSHDEVECIKDLCSKFDGLVVLEDGEGKRKKVSIVKKS